MGIGELESVFRVFAEWGKCLSVPFRSGIVIRDVGDGEVVPHMAFGEGAVSANILDTLIAVPTSEKDTASAG